MGERGRGGGVVLMGWPTVIAGTLGRVLISEVTNNKQLVRNMRFFGRRWMRKLLEKVDFWANKLVGPTVPTTLFTNAGRRAPRDNLSL
jgi:hypothetical protein